MVVAIGSGDREHPLKQNYPYLESVSNRFYALIDEPYEELDEASDLDSTTGERSMLDAGQGLGIASEGKNRSLPPILRHATAGGFDTSGRGRHNLSVGR